MDYQINLQRGDEEAYDKLHRLFTNNTNEFVFELIDPYAGRGVVITNGVGKYIKIFKKNKKTIFKVVMFLIGVGTGELRNIIMVNNYNQPIEQVKIEQTINKTFNIEIIIADTLYEVKNVTRDQALNQLQQWEDSCE